MSSGSPSRLGIVTGLSVAVAVLMIAQQVAGKAVRDAFFLSVYEVEVLTQVMTVSSVVSVAAVLFVMRLYRRFSPARLVPLFFGLSAGLFALEWVLVQAGSERAAALILYVHMASMGAVAISGFWAVLNERFDPYTAKRVIGKVASGATAGGVLGGVAAWQGAASLSISTMLMVLLASNTLCGLGVIAIGRGATPVGSNAAPTTARTKSRKRTPAIFEVFETSPYLRHVAALVVLVAFGTAGVDYVFKATAAAAYDTSSELVSFFALFYLATGIAAFVVQNSFANWFLRKAGIAAAVATLPLTLVIFGPVALLFPGLSAMAMLRGTAATAESSSYRSGYELLYTPLSAATKRPAKTLIDVGADKLGAAVGSAFAVFLVGLLPGSANIILIISGVVCALTALWLSRALGRGYVAALAERLSAGTLDEDAIAALGDNERHVVEATLAAIDTAAVLRGLSEPALRTASRASFDSAHEAITAQPSAVAGPSVFATSAAALTTAPSAEVVAALRATHPVPRPWVGVLLPRLAEPECAEAVATALTQAAPASLGALFDGLRDPDVPLPARLRIAEIVSHVPTQRCVDELVRALQAPHFGIRFAAARALRSIATKRTDLEIPTTRLGRAIVAELQSVSRLTVRSQLATNDPAARDVVLAGHRFAYALTLLGHTIPEEALWLAVTALTASDQRRRGTALEYLDNVFDTEIAAVAAPLLANPAIAQVAVTARDAEVSAAPPSLTPTLSELRARLEGQRA